MEEKLQTCGIGKNKKCKKGSKPIPTNKKLYKSVTNDIKKHVQKWPSRYASYNVIKLYKKKGGKYRCSNFGKSADKFYEGVGNSFLTPQVKQCLSKVYGPSVLATTHRFGSKKKRNVRTTVNLKTINSEINYLLKLR
jgi:hypothetical protein